MSGTRPESDNELAGVTSLADAIRGDEPEDTRSCRQETCEGSLAVRNDDTVYCTSCYCTPAGVFVPPDHDERGSSSGTTGFPSYNPYPSRGENTRVGSWEHGTYNNSGLTRLAGGHEPVYDEDDDRRPNGVGTEYTFDLTTL